MKRVVNSSEHREAKTASRPANSILATAETAWDLDVAHKEAEVEEKSLVSEEQPIREDLPKSH